MLRSSRSCFFHPADDRAARTLDVIGLRQSHRMDDQRDDGPPRYRDQPDVGASAKRREEQDREVRVAARGDEAEIAVEFLPDMDIHAEVLDEQSLDYALEPKIGRASCRERVWQ